MKKIFIASLLVAASTMLVHISCFGQLTISGATCVLSGTEYQYNIAGNMPDGAQLCVKGGTITGSSSDCISNLGAGYVRVTWSGNKGSVTLSSSAGNSSLDITVTTPLQAGSITTSKSEFINFKAACSAISCSKPAGGGCGATYSYQWQRSFDNLKWEDIKGATSQNLGSLADLQGSYFYRRRVTELSSGTTAYSDATVVYVVPEFKTN